MVGSPTLLMVDLLTLTHCESIYDILDMDTMRRAKNSLNLSSASVISLYEELALSLVSR